MANAITHIDVEASRLAKQGFVAGSAATAAVAGGVVLGIRLGFNNHASEQRAIRLAFHQQAADELGGDETSAGRVKKDGGRGSGRCCGYGSGYN